MPSCGHDNALGAPGRTGGVDHVRGARRVVGLGEITLRRTLREDVPDHSHRLGVRQHERQPLRRIVGVQRQIRPARPVHRQQCDHQLHRPGQRDGDSPLRAHAHAGQHPGRPLDTLVQLGVRQPLFAEHQRQRVRRTGHLGPEQLGQAGGRHVTGGVVPVAQNSPPLRLLQHLQIPHRQVGRARHLLQQPHQTSRCPGGRRLVAEVGGVLQEKGQPVRLVHEGEVEVELGHAGVHVEPVGRHAEHVGVAVGAEVVAQHDLEERVAAGYAGRVDGLDDPVEGQVLVLERGEGRFPHPCRAVRRNVRSSPDRSVRSTSVLTKKPTRSSSASSVRPAMGAPSGMSSPAPRRCSSAAVAAWNSMNMLVPVVPDRSRRARPMSAGSSRRTLPPRPVGSAGRGRSRGRRSSSGRSRKRLGPVGELARADLAEQLVLPEGVVGVLDRQRRPLGGAARAPGPVGGRRGRPGTGGRTTRRS